MQSEARRRANDKWSKKALEQIAIRVRKGTRDTWKQAADASGMSLASYIQEAVKEKMEREKELS